mmetsp:Transcript_11475/g.37599  ORF Transcript_11475/g.37599 Transcript_11475/m.37599 type:complete len:210 (-) Transcript_11475:192-821(-)
MRSGSAGGGDVSRFSAESSTAGRSSESSDEFRPSSEPDRASSLPPLLSEDTTLTLPWLVDHSSGRQSAAGGAPGSQRGASALAPAAAARTQRAAAGWWSSAARRSTRLRPSSASLRSRPRSSRADRLAKRTAHASSTVIVGGARARMAPYTAKRSFAAVISSTNCFLRTRLVQADRRLAARLRRFFSSSRVCSRRDCSVVGGGLVCWLL